MFDGTNHHAVAKKMQGIRDRLLLPFGIIRVRKYVVHASVQNSTVSTWRPSSVVLIGMNPRRPCSPRSRRRKKLFIIYPIGLNEGENG
jgi:hypothetical protein